MSSPCEQGDDNPSALPSDIIDKTRFCQIASLRTAGFTRGNTTASQGMKPILLTRQRSNVFELIKENSARGFLILKISSSLYNVHYFMLPRDLLLFYHFSKIQLPFTFLECIQKARGNQQCRNLLFNLQVKLTGKIEFQARKSCKDASRESPLKSQGFFVGGFEMEVLVRLPKSNIKKSFYIVTRPM